MVFSSKLIEDAVESFSQLPGIGRKTALRMVLHLLKTDEDKVKLFSETISKMRSEIKFCKTCNNVSDFDVCSICSNPSRNNGQVCVVENIRDVIAIESTQQYNGRYHVLGGLLSPLDGIGPDQLCIDPLISHVQQGDITEIIMALSPTIEGDTTVFYISKKISNSSIKITTIARGIAFGGELEYADEMTLARSIAKRLPIDNYVSIPNQHTE